MLRIQAGSLTSRLLFVQGESFITTEVKGKLADSSIYFQDGLAPSLSLSLSLSALYILVDNMCCRNNLHYGPKSIGLIF